MSWKRNAVRVAICWLVASNSWVSAAWNEPWYHTFGRWIGYGFGDGYHACPDANCGPCQAHGSAFTDNWTTSDCPSCNQGPSPTPIVPVPSVTQRGLPGLDAPVANRSVAKPNRATAQRPPRAKTAAVPSSPAWPTR